MERGKLSKKTTNVSEVLKRELSARLKGSANG